MLAFDDSISVRAVTVRGEGNATVKSLCTVPVRNSNGFASVVVNCLLGKERTLLDVVGADPVGP